MIIQRACSLHTHTNENPTCEIHPALILKIFTNENEKSF